MIILLPKKAEYKNGDDFPFLTVPLDMKGAESASFEDFQWWAKSEDFQKWLDKNPRSWVADSEDMSKYANVAEYIKEKYNFNLDDINVSLNENDLDNGVISFSNFSKLNEDTNTADDDPKFREAIKFHFAYNKLKSEGKIDETLSPGEILDGNEKAIFICGNDPDTGEDIQETLKAVKMKSFTKSQSASKIMLLDVNEMYPGGPIPENETAEGLTQKIIQDASILAVMGGVSITLFGALKAAGGALSGALLLKSISGFRIDPKNKTQVPPGVMDKIKNYGGSAIKSLWGGAKDVALLKNTRTIGSSIVRGAKGAKSAYTLGKVGAKGALKAFSKGFTRGAAQGGAKLIPFVGEILILTDVIGSAWNWFSDKQAPKYNEVKSFAQREMDPKKIPIGVPITICWSQPAGGGWGTVTSFLFNNETRTTAEFIKIADKNNYSILILTQVNSKEAQKQLAEHDLVLVALDNNDIVNDQEGALNTIARVFDNEDLDFKISYVDGISKLATIFKFKGMCDWDVFKTALDSSSDQLIISDDSAPENYEFYYQDNEGDVINVVGRLMNNDELRSTSKDDIDKIFIPKEVKEDSGNGSKKNESEDGGLVYMDLVNENDVITSFSSFSDRIYGINEDKKSGDIVSLSSDDLSTPAKVAIYWVTDREYADPELRKYKTGKFTNFTIDPSDYGAKRGESISVQTNTINEDINNPKRGVYQFKKAKLDNKKDGRESDIVTVVNPKTDEKKPEVSGDKVEGKVSDDYYIKVDPNDVKIKDRRSSTIIRDNSVTGGINLIDKFLSDKEKEVLGVEGWKAISFAKALQDNRGDIVEVKLKNKFASPGDRVRKYRVTDGEAFQIAKKFTTEVEDRIKYE